MTASAITLFDRSEAMCAAWRHAFADVPGVTVTRSTLEDLPDHDVLVTAGNSHGIMDGGLDLDVRTLLGQRVQDAVQWQAAASLGGIIPVGTCVTVPTGSKRFPWLVYAPTMPTPQTIPPSHVLLATCAVLTNRYDDGQTIACPGLGAGVGGLPPEVVADTMRTAWNLTRPTPHADAAPQIAGIIREYGQAIRGDWGSIDGGSVRDELEQIAEWLYRPDTFPGTSPARDNLGICPTGAGHWTDYCGEDCRAEGDR